MSLGLCTLLLCLFSFSCKTSHQHKEKEQYQEINLGEIKVYANPEYKGFDTKYFDLLHMKLSVIPRWKKHQLDGVAVLTLTPHAYPMDTLVLDAQDFDIKKIQLVGIYEDSITDLQYKYDKRKIYIALQNYELSYTIYPPLSAIPKHRKQNRRNQPGDPFSIKIEYTAKPEDQYKDSVISKKIEQGLYFINPDGTDSGMPTEVWSQGETQHNSSWFPTIDAVNQKLTEEIDITVDTGMVTLSNGLLKSSQRNMDGTRTDYWVMDKPHSPYLVMMAAGRFSVIHDQWRGKPVNYYVEKEYAPYARMIFGHTPAMIEYFSNLLKYDFQWQKYSQMVVRDFTSGAMENTTAVLMYEPMQHDDRAHLDYTGEETISHELFHHWFGDLVTCKSWAYLALNESFASWAESVWQEHEYDKDEADLMRKSALDAYLNEAMYHKGSIIDHYYNDPEDLFDRHRYEKGALVINMLRHELGDSIFFKGLHNYLMAHQWKNVELADLREAMEDVSGKDLNWFFEQWFEKPGHPIFELSQYIDTARHKLYVYVNQTQKEDKVPVFRMPVHIKFAYQNFLTPIQIPYLVEDHTVWLQHEKDTFVFNLPNSSERVLDVYFDPANVLLCQKAESKPVNQWLFQYYNSHENFRNRLEALESLSKYNKQLSIDESEKLWSAALNDPFWYVRKYALQSLPDLPDTIFKPLIPEIGKLAWQDKKAIVRATALVVLQDKTGDKSMDIYDKALNDSSYQVVATAIRNVFSNYPRNDSAALVKRLYAYDRYRSQDVMMALANVYAWYGDTEKAAFFRSIRGFGGQYFTFYRRYLERMDCSFIQSQENFILNLDKYTRSPWELSLYRTFLYDLSSSLSQRRSGTTVATCKKLAEDFKQKAQTIVVKF
jgi:aminopeptidase N